MTMEPPPRIALSVAETAIACGVSDDTVRRWIARGDLRAAHVGRVLVPVAEITRFLEANSGVAA